MRVKQRNALRLSTFIIPLALGVSLVASSHAFEPAPVENRDFLDVEVTSVEKMLQAVGRMANADQSIEEYLTRIRSRMFLVFVPGILGSTISVNGTMAWGKSFPPTSKQLEKLALPSSLVDENSDNPSVHVELLRSLDGRDVYGEAADRLRATAKKFGIEFIECPYDWRRDIRNAARVLEEQCLQSVKGAGEGDPPAAFIIVAHSMGGVVTWEWHSRYYRRYGEDERAKRRLRAVVVLGSPLLGGCEMLRMVRAGYVQPHKSWLRSPSDFWGRFKDWISSTYIENIENRYTSYVTQDMRATLLTWPGAWELTPKHSVELRNHCIPLRKAGADPSDDRVHSYYELSFWDTPLGRDFRKMSGGFVPLPSHFDEVLKKAKEFRDNFDSGALDIPMFFFYSKSWNTPATFRFTGDKLVGGDKIVGDGRVSLESALGGTSSFQRWSMEVPSVHGDIPKDKRFEWWFDKRRLPEIINAHMAVAAAQFIQRLPGWEIRYLEVNGEVVPWQDIETALHGNSPTSTLQENKVDKEVILRFNNAVFTVSSVVPISRDRFVRMNRALVGLGTFSQNHQIAAGFEYQMATRLVSRVQEMQDMAQIGLAFSRAQSNVSAIGPLGFALAGMEPLPEFKKGGLLNLKLAVTRNLGFKLFRAGECREAERYLKKAVREATSLGRVGPTIDLARRFLRSPCRDRETNATIVFSEQ